jgi:hypothetical protein
VAPLQTREKFGATSSFRDQILNQYPSPTTANITPALREHGENSRIITTPFVLPFTAIRHSSSFQLPPQLIDGVKLVAVLFASATFNFLNLIFSL